MSASGPSNKPRHSQHFNQPVSSIAGVIHAEVETQLRRKLQIGPISLYTRRSILQDILQNHEITC